MKFKNQNLIKLLLVSLALLIFVDIVCLFLNIYDISYLKRIIAEENVSEAEDNFFSFKNNIEYWVSHSVSLLYSIIFLTWFYRAYKNAYLRDTEHAPFKPSIVPFSYFLPVFNFYGPFKIMKHIWHNYSETEDEVQSGYRRIKLWWFLSILTWVASKILAQKYARAEYADEYLIITYGYILYNAFSIHWSILTIKLTYHIDKMECRIIELKADSHT